MKALNLNLNLGNESTSRKVGLHLTDDGRTILLFAVAAMLGGASWSGRPFLNSFALLYPFVYLNSSRRIDTLSTVFYYAASTVTVVHAAQQFFGIGTNPLQPILIWLALITLGSAPWLCFYSQRFLPFSTIASLTALAVPPLSLVTVAYPLIAAGHWFPGTRWFGLALPILLIATYRRLGAPTTAAILLGASLVVHVRFHRPAPDPRIVALSTDVGSHPNQKVVLDSPATELALQRQALAHPETLLLLPESVLPGWSLIHEERWTETFQQLKRQQTGLLIGTTIPIPNSDANWNVLLSRGYSERLSYVQRVPVPLGMWHLGSTSDGFPLMLRYPATIRIWGHRAGVLVCYEQFLVWPALQTLSQNPDMLLAPSNLYWGQGTSLPAIQHISAQGWADLWGIPLYEATNR